MDFHDYWNMIRRHLWLVAASIMVPLIASVIYIILAHPVYESNCTLLITNSKSQRVLTENSEKTLLNETIGNKADPIVTQVALIKKRPIIQRVINELNLKSPEGITLNTEAIEGNITVTPISETDLVLLEFRSGNPQMAAQVVNTLAKAFVEESQKLSYENLSQQKANLEDQMNKQKTIMTESQNNLLNFKQNYQSISLEQETSVKINSIATLESSKRELETKLQGAHAQKNNLLQKINEATSQSSPFYPTWISNLDQINYEISNLSAQLNNVLGQIDILKGSIRNVPPQEIELARLSREARTDEEVYTKLQEKYEETKLNESNQVSNIKIVEPAIASDIPVSPQKKKIIPLAIIVGLMLGISLALVLEYFNDVPNSTEEIQKMFSLTKLGEIPFKKEMDNLFVMNDNRSLMAESIRIIYANLKYCNTLAKEKISLLITSSIPGEGKSTLSANLAMVFAMTGKKTILVDLDLRRPSLGKKFNIADKPGLSDYIVLDTSLQNIVQQEPKSKLHIIHAGSVTTTSGSLLANTKVQQLQKSLQENYDVVIFDSPPITLVGETIDLCKSMDGIIITVCMKTATRRALKALKEILKGKNLPILGIVYNKITRDKASYNTQTYNYDY